MHSIIIGYLLNNGKEISNSFILHAGDKL